MSTHVPSFQSFFSFLHHFVLSKLAILTLRVKHEKCLFPVTLPTIVWSGLLSQVFIDMVLSCKGSHLIVFFTVVVKVNNKQAKKRNTAKYSNSVLIPYNPSIYLLPKEASLLLEIIVSSWFEMCRFYQTIM